MSKIIFSAATIVTAWGIVRNLFEDGALGGTGTMSMNTYYLLGTTLFVAAAAAHFIWPEKKDLTQQ
ncbi:MAG: hypothetical protein MUE35_11120 [Hydrogenophaga sp.]|nr:hypothetical protein [Hydrogenophaga sp.]